MKAYVLYSLLLGVVEYWSTPVVDLLLSTKLMRTLLHYCTVAIDRLLL
jgi:hypothetical protein